MKATGLLFAMFVVLVAAGCASFSMPEPPPYARGGYPAAYPLHSACMLGDYQRAQRLLAAMPELVERKDSYEQTPLCTLVMKGGGTEQNRISIAGALILNGAHPDEQFEGVPLFNYAFARGDLNLTKFLRDRTPIIIKDDGSRIRRRP